MLIEYMRLWNARKWMKRNEPFLPTWHAHLGYSLDLFTHFQKGALVEEVAQANELNQDLLQRWVEVGIVLGHLKEGRKGKVKAKKQLVKYVSKESPASVGILLKEMMELHIPTMLSYKDLMQGKDINFFETDYGDTVAQTSALLETLAFPKISEYIKKLHARSVFDIGCGYGGYLKRLHVKFPKIELSGLEVDEEVAKKAQKDVESTLISIVQGDIHTYDVNKSYDVVMMNNLLYYFSEEDRFKLFQKANQCLNRKGFLIIISPLVESKHGQAFASAFNSFMSAHEKMYPVPSKSELEEYARQTKFQLKDVIPVVKEGGWYMLAFKKK
ncbi:class I SAM-dependent methyltransferase [Halalkalibacter nanhaiisediminis]|uniref:Methyltransferase family protein n=1 Tax=Halalkalibacter nanhaiisediminis TaxID=688079 RepID=A0A562QSQ8_9BACI|nr:class I SAM-dependent methyltransferase [Halalkalibacter nanhaiisediminis]TWI59220.1 methyltransferase family protein [Halalkalibacter nanhaiisediminis]